MHKLLGHKLLMRVLGHRAEPLEELLVATGRGDLAAFAALDDALRARVEALAHRILRDRHLAQEVTQEVLVETWRTAGRFDPTRGSVVSWVLTMTHRRSVDRVRAEQASRRRHAVYELRSAGVPFDETAAAGEARIASTAVHSAVAGLTPLQRQAIELTYFRGLTQVQVAAHLGVPLGTVKSRIRDGLGRMRKVLPQLAPEAA